MWRRSLGSLGGTGVEILGGVERVDEEEEVSEEGEVEDSGEKVSDNDEVEWGDGKKGSQSREGGGGLREEGDQGTWGLRGWCGGLRKWGFVSEMKGRGRDGGGVVGGRGEGVGAELRVESGVGSAPSSWGIGEWEIFALAKSFAWRGRRLCWGGCCGG